MKCTLGNISQLMRKNWFQGRHPDIQLINYNMEGYGLLLDSVFSYGYTYSLYFRNQVSPKRFLDICMSPLNERVNALYEQLPLHNYVISMDNLYMSSIISRFVIVCN